MHLSYAPTATGGIRIIAVTAPVGGGASVRTGNVQQIARSAEDQVFACTETTNDIAKTAEDQAFVSTERASLRGQAPGYKTDGKMSTKCHGFVAIDSIKNAAMVPKYTTSFHVAEAGRALRVYPG